MEFCLEAKEINKTFGGIRALDKVDFRLKKGEVHCLVGENGAGESTLGKIIAGIHTPDSGKIFINDKLFERFSPLQAKEEKISMVMQELNLMSHLTIAENIFMFENDVYIKSLFLNRRIIYQKTDALLKKLNLLDFPSVNTKVDKLTIAQQQIVEVMKAVSIKNNILILDEPTASLSLNEVNQLFELVNRLKKEDVSIILITHRLNEVFQIGDLVTILCDGKIVKERIPVDELDEQKIVKLMIGRDIKNFFGKKQKLEIGKPVLVVDSLTDGKKIFNISFKLHKQEILGFAGLVGAGRTEIAETIFGIRKRKSGKIFIKDKYLKAYDAEYMVSNRIAFVPEDRKLKGLFMNLSILININIINYNLQKSFIINDRQYREQNTDLIARFKIRIKSLYEPVRNLSGGNQQKVLLSRWMMLDPEIFILDEPTRGVDVGTKSEIYNLMKELTKKGKSIIFISSEMQELIALCDRIIVVSEGRITNELKQEDATEEKILVSSIPGKRSI